MRRLRVAIVTTDGREMMREYVRPQPMFGTSPMALLQGLARIPDVDVHVISCTQRPVATPGTLAPNIRFHSLLVPKIGWLRTAYAGCIRAVRTRLREIQPDLVHGQGTERECAMAAVWSGFPNVLTIHGIMREMARSARARVGSFAWCTARLEGHVLRRTGGVFCNSRYTESMIQGRTARTWFVPNPVRETFFLTPWPARRSGPPVLLNVGVVSANKRQRELLAMAHQLHARGLHFILRFVGQADPANAYANQFLAELPTAIRMGYAAFDGLKLDQELVAAYDAASALVHFPQVETFGLVVAEGLARGLKFFGNRCGGVVDVAAGADGAELFELNDLAALEAGIEQWLRAGAPMPQDPGARVRELYHPDAIARRHVRIYREVLGGSVAPGVSHDGVDPE